MKKSLALLLLIFFAAAAQAQKEAQLPKDLPAYGPQPAFQPPDIKTSKLENGLTVWLVPQSGVPKVSFALVTLGGLASDPSGQPGLSELLARALTQGTRTRSAKQIAEEIQAAGGDLASSADRDRTSLGTAVLSSKIEPAITLLADVAQNATFPDNEVALAKRNLSNSLRQREAQPGFQANKTLARVLFGTGPYSVIAPTQESLSQMTADQLRQEFAGRFRPDQTLLVAVGDFDAGKLSALIKEKFGTWRGPAVHAPVLNAKPTTVPPHQITFVARPNSVQTTLVLAGWGPLRSDPDYEASEVADAIYGGTFGSRLVRNIREDKGYTYSPGSGLAILRQAGMLRTQADVRNEVTGASLNEMIYELNRMVTTSPTEDELGRAKRFLLGIEAVSLQSHRGMVGELVQLWLNGLGPDGIAAYNRKIGATSANDVDAAAHKYFPAAHMTIVAVGEEKVIRDALAPFGMPVEQAK